MMTTVNIDELKPGVETDRLVTEFVFTGGDDG